MELFKSMLLFVFKTPATSNYSKKIWLVVRVAVVMSPSVSREIQLFQRHAVHLKSVLHSLLLIVMKNWLFLTVPYWMFLFIEIVI